METYKYLYYRLFCIWLNKKDEAENAYINAVITISLLVCLNILSIPLVIMAFFGKDIITIPELPEKWIIFIIVIAYGLSQYFLLAHKKKYINIINKYKDETEKERKKGLFYTWSYIITSIGIPIYIFFFTIPK